MQVTLYSMWSPQSVIWAFTYFEAGLLTISIIICIHDAVSLYDPDSEFTVSSLQRLQNEGFNFLPLLDRYKFKDHTKKIPAHNVHSLYLAEPEEPLGIVVDGWLDHVGKPPTWRSLLEVLQS